MRTAHISTPYLGVIKLVRPPSNAMSSGLADGSGEMRNFARFATSPMRTMRDNDETGARIEIADLPVGGDMRAVNERWGRAPHSSSPPPHPEGQLLRQE